mgnify:CR=1 FL=1
MNNIQEKDWAEDDWHSHTGIDSSCDYCVGDGLAGATESRQAGQGQYPADGCTDSDGLDSVAQK